MLADCVRSFTVRTSLSVDSTRTISAASGVKDNYSSFETLS